MKGAILKNEALHELCKRNGCRHSCRSYCGGCCAVRVQELPYAKAQDRQGRQSHVRYNGGYTGTSEVAGAGLVGVGTRKMGCQK